MVASAAVSQVKEDRAQGWAVIGLWCDDLLQGRGWQGWGGALQLPFLPLPHLSQLHQEAPAAKALIPGRGQVGAHDFSSSPKCHQLAPHLHPPKSKGGVHSSDKL